MGTLSADVLVIGAGAAGIRAALAASEAGAEVILMAKGKMGRAGSTFSPVSKGWGIQALVGEERTDENMEAFYNDVIRVGLGRCDERLVRILVEESGPRLEDLISYGIQFKKDSQGNYKRAKGCFSEYERAFLTEDLKNIKEAFMSALRRSSAKLISGRVVELLIGDNSCWGCWAVTDTGKIIKIEAKATVLATGGGAAIFKDHLVSDGEIGDGYVLACRAGAKLDNMEFIQFMLGLKGGENRLFLPLSGLDTYGKLCDSKGLDLLEGYIPDPKTRALAVHERQRHFPFSSRDLSCLVDIALAWERRNGKRPFWKGRGEREPQH
ncbi:MAG: FAD-binding protein [Desulfobacteraceae bacterium]|nr:FAD-binding protein [Desulfobacteraceae bacterium]